MKSINFGNCYTANNILLINNVIWTDKVKTIKLVPCYTNNISILVLL